ncbi:acetyltransferase [Pseudodesulfovibrio sp.]|uniref:acetyltransferase n=1 Tax=Pseudodesulfovibrio sp. TaxID=2035812 RepID=UPI00261EDA63|nr:acetyltransferase [Pseudodesulfovibrio sp.]MDD3312095.1 acetyltransferase [Pseudodesulfovibrio sp.]
MKVLIVGSGGHARVVADILLAAPGVDPMGFLAPGTGAGEPFRGLAVLGRDPADVTGHDGVVLAVGDNRARAALAEDYARRGVAFVPAVHPSAIVAPDAELGPGCVICAGAVVGAGARIGAHAILNTGCSVDHDCVVGACCHVAPGARLAGAVTLGTGAFIGIGACVIQGRTIGDWATAGAGAAVVRNVRPGAVVVGVPARELQES